MSGGGQHGGGCWLREATSAVVNEINGEDDGPCWVLTLNSSSKLAGICLRNSLRNTAGPRANAAELNLDGRREGKSDFSPELMID